ncbi:alpha/beta fold hydrolase [Bythopirellula polymerisocia]|uniref:3-oxoadipate enol-lactonase 2 n=1 Tax=Bythopirellula polymerisocia TaxID=2528003 RepID=A0A5C6D422_9BACT|nr:alpha/beta hydrolase [Bythopirellula polymerisocia]TWU30417.1 3-oxoadipate enol-lactonase 2 [Bythopirellula polymerisocia]
MIKSVQLDTIQLTYSDSGSGQPVVLLHGFPLDHAMWTPQIVALSDHARVIAPDLRGFGQSTLGPQDAEQGVEMHQYAADILGLLDKIGVKEPVILCGFSMGGYILWQFALRYPERVKAIVLCDTRAVADTAEAREGRIKTADEVLRLGTDSLVAGMLPKMLSKATLSQRPEVVRQVTQIMRSCQPAAVAAALRGMAEREDVTAKLAKISQPALIIVGTEDAISPPAEMRSISESLSHVQFVEIPEAGHMTTMENAGAVSESLQRFVTEMTGG